MHRAYCVFCAGARLRMWVPLHAHDEDTAIDGLSHHWGCTLVMDAGGMRPSGLRFGAAVVP